MKKLSNAKWFILGVAVCLIVSQLVAPAIAANFSKQSTLYYQDIKITLNGTALTPTDASGNVVEPFIIDGTTYLPVRGISNALGLGVEWDGPTNTVKLTGSMGGGTSANLNQYMQACKAYDRLDDAYSSLRGAYLTLSTCYLICVAPSNSDSDFNVTYNDTNEIIKSNGEAEKKISAARDAINSLSGDSWVTAEISKMKVCLDKLVSALDYMRLALDGVYKISIGDSSGTAIFKRNTGNSSVLLDSINEYIDNGLSASLDKILTASAG